MARDDATPEQLATIRNHLALALDVPDLEQALELAREVAPISRIAKVGLELYSAAGPSAIAALRNVGFSVFVDLKLHDIPTTVRRTAGVIAGLGAAYLTVHTAGGLAMCAAAVEGLAEGAHPGQTAPIGLGVTVLTSEADPPAGLLTERAGLAAAAGLRGLVCAAVDLNVVRGAAPGLVCVVPGTRLPGESHDDQARVATPAAALASGADILVIGRAVTGASAPATAASALVDHLQRAAAGVPG